MMGFNYMTVRGAECPLWLGVLISVLIFGGIVGTVIYCVFFFGKDDN